MTNFRPLPRCAMAKAFRPDVFAHECPSRAVLARIANKWSMLVVDSLADGTLRNGQLLRRIAGISPKMLAETLRELEALNLVSRRCLDSVPPHVEYTLTPLGHELRALVCGLDRWIEGNLDAMRPEPPDS